MLVGRDRECARIDELLAGALKGESGSLIVRGEPGIGKSALLDYAAARADGMELLTTAGVEAEADLAFAGLYGLLRPILGRLSELPEIQAEALAGALALAPSSGSDRFLTSAAVLGLLAEAAEERPLLCLVEDAHWLDTPSADALVFAARRLRAERVAIIFAVREGEPSSFEGRGVPELLLTGLEKEDALALLADSSSEIVSSVREQLLVEAGGNPLALLELPAGLSGDQRAGIEALPDSIPLTARVQAAFAATVEGLPAATRAMLFIAAADDTGDVATVVRASAELGLAAEALEPAEAAGRRAHRRRSGCVPPPPRPRRGAQRGDARAAAADARRARRRPPRRGARRPARLASRAGDADRRRERRGGAGGGRATLAASRRTGVGGDRVRARGGAQRRRSRRAAGASARRPRPPGRPGNRSAPAALGTRSFPHADGLQRVRLLYLSALIEARSGWLPDAFAPLLEAIEGSKDASLTLEMLRDAYELAGSAGNHEQLVEITRRAAQVEPATETDRFIAALLAWGSELSGDYSRGALLAAEAIERAERLDDPRCLEWAALIADREGTWGDGLPHANRAVALARERGLASELPQALAFQSTELIGRSRFDLGYSAAEEGRRLALDIDQPFFAIWNFINLATVEALRGQEDEARAHVDALQQLVAASGASLLSIFAERVLGLLELTLGRPAEALEHLRRFAAAPAGVATIPHRVLGLPDTVEAAVRARQLDEAADHLARFQEWVERFPTPARLSLLARCQALAAESAAEPHFVRSIELGRGPVAVRAGAERAACTGNGCGASGAGWTLVPICGPLSSCSSGSPSRPGKSGRAPSCARAERRRAAAIPPRAISSPRKSCRSPTW